MLGTANIRAPPLMRELKDISQMVARARVQLHGIASAYERHEPTVDEKSIPSGID